MRISNAAILRVGLIGLAGMAALSILDIATLGDPGPLATLLMTPIVLVCLALVAIPIVFVINFVSGVLYGISSFDFQYARWMVARNSDAVVGAVLLIAAVAALARAINKIL